MTTNIIVGLRNDNSIAQAPALLPKLNVQPSAGFLLGTIHLVSRFEK
jgi:hypothetical protein